jgi:hypothetical protein
MNMDELSVHDTMAGELVARGMATADQVAASRTSLQAELSGEGGIDPLAGPAHQQATHVTEDDDGSGISAAAFSAPASPAGYHFDAAPSGAQIDLEAQVAWRSALFHEGVAAPLAREMDRRMMRGLVSPPSEQQGALSQQAGMQALAKIWGAEHRDANLAVAQREVQRLAVRRPELIAMLNASGFGNDPWLAVTLVNHARAKGRA